MPMERLKGKHLCDFCHNPSIIPAKLRILDKIYICCDGCVEKIDAVLEEWYMWANLPEKMLSREISNANALTRKNILADYGDE